MGKGSDVNAETPFAAETGAAVTREMTAAHFFYFKAQRPVLRRISRSATSPVRRFSLESMGLVAHLRSIVEKSFQRVRAEKGREG